MATTVQQGQEYRHRTVKVDYYWHFEIQGIHPADDADLQEVLRTLKEKHNWPVGRQVFIGEGEVGVGLPNSSGLLAYNNYRDSIRVGPHRDDVVVTTWTKDRLL